MLIYCQLMRKIITGGADDPGVSFRLKLLWVYRCWLEKKIKTVKTAQVLKEQFSPARNNRFVRALMSLMLQKVTHQSEFVGHASVGRQLGTKAQRWEHLVTVVVLNDLSHSFESHAVGVQLVWIHVVQGSWLGRVA